MHRLKTNTTSTLQLNCTEMAELQWTPSYRVYLQLTCAFGLPSCKPVVVVFLFFGFQRTGVRSFEKLYYIIRLPV